MNTSISVLIGALISVMLMLNGTLSAASGNYTSSVIIHIVGFFFITLVMLINKSNIKIQKDIPIYLYSAGAIGVFTVLLSNLSFLKLGASLTVALGLLGQSLSAIVIDHFGLLEMQIFKFEKKKLIGLVFIILGIFIMTIY